MFALAFPILCLCASLLVLVFVLHKVKALFISNTYTISREVENGEGASVVFNGYIWDNPERAFNRYQKLVAPVEMRKAFCHERFENVLKLSREA